MMSAAFTATEMGHDIPRRPQITDLTMHGLEPASAEKLDEHLIDLSNVKKFTVFVTNVGTEGRDYIFREISSTVEELEVWFDECFQLRLSG